MVTSPDPPDPFEGATPPADALPTTPPLRPSVYPGPSPRDTPPPTRTRRRQDTKQKAKEIGQNIRTTRLQSNMTQPDLIARLGHGTSTWLSRIENGHQLITLTILEEIAEALEVSLDELRASNPPVSEPDPQIYGPRIRALRQQQGLTQVQLLEKLGHGDGKWLSGVEHGQHRVRPANLENLARALGVSVNDLIAETSPLDSPDLNGEAAS